MDMESDPKSITDIAAIRPDNVRFWFCVQTHPKHESIAGRSLVKVGGFEVFNPQMRIRRATKRGPVWFTESAFPGYIFARFNLQLHLDTVRYSPSVSKVVHFRTGYPSVPDLHVNELRAVFGAEQVVVLTPEVSPGDSVRIVGGAFNDLLGVVQQVKSGKQRVTALLDFLGHMRTVELDLKCIVVEERCRAPYHPLNHAEIFVRSEIKARNWT
jgi:transcriptional antiterminator RfaH